MVCVFDGMFAMIIVMIVIVVMVRCTILGDQAGASDASIVLFEDSVGKRAKQSHICTFVSNVQQHQNVHCWLLYRKRWNVP